MSEEPRAEPFQAQVKPWLLACFGEMIAGDREERNHRFLEEALELVQACGCTASEAHQLVDYVFGRPIGELHQEVGGVMVTLAALCLANDADMHAAGFVELHRIWGKVEQIRAKQAAKPKHSPFAEHTASFASSAAGQQEGWADRLREAVTPTGETKAAYMGEFSWTDWVEDENGHQQGHERVVPWPVIREIMAAIRDRAGVDRMDEADCLAVIASPSAPEERRDEVEVLKTEIVRQCGIGAGNFYEDSETGLWEIVADLDPAGLRAALTTVPGER